MKRVTGRDSQSTLHGQLLQKTRFAVRKQDVLSGEIQTTSRQHLASLRASSATLSPSHLRCHSRRQTDDNPRKVTAFKQLSKTCSNKVLTKLAGAPVVHRTHIFAAIPSFQHTRNRLARMKSEAAYLDLALKHTRKCYG